MTRRGRGVIAFLTTALLPGTIFLTPLVDAAPVPAKTVSKAVADDRFEVLGCPAQKQYPDNTDRVYARNVWSLAAFDSRLYIGEGNASNLPPAPNAGPTTVWSYDPASGLFTDEGSVLDEQIDSFRVLLGGSILAIPGLDPQQSWELGNLYLRRAGTADLRPWQTVRTIPNGVHCFDLIEWPPGSGTLLTALGTQKGGAVARSTDGGQHWETLPLPNGAQRAYRFLEVGAALYVSSSSLEGQGDKRPPHALYRMSGNGFAVMTDTVYPRMSKEDMARAVPVRVTPISGDTTLYIGARNVNDQQWEPLALYSASTLGDTGDRLRVRPLLLPSGAGLPFDLRRDGDRLYCLTCYDEGEGVAGIDGPSRYRISVYVSDSQAIEIGRAHWRRVLTFHAPTFARSFERMGGYFYFGLGCGTKRLAAETGQIWRVAIPGKG